MITDQQKTDIRRFCGYPAYGAAPSGNIGWRFYTAYGLLEYRMNNLSAAELNVVQNYLTALNQLEMAIPDSGSNLDTESAAGWVHNPDEIANRSRLLESWSRRLCAFFGIPPGEGLQAGTVNWIV